VIWKRKTTMSQTEAVSLFCINTRIIAMFSLINLITYLLTYWLTFCMKQSPSWEPNGFSASQEISHILWIPKVHYRIYNSPPLVCILSHINPVHAPHPYPEKILILSSHICLGVPIVLFPSGFATKILYTPPFTPILATCPAYLILLDLFTRIIFAEEYRSFSSSLCSFLHSLITLSHLEPNTLLSTPF